ncbi:MAG TPA: pyridoxamine 5'-phosphate oxidase family protein [Caulobacteraceae bacterium]|nr:pyridoxamine 5'-phosphate oxidase family protein [Caulobacteraceae bacterium]
MSAKLNDEAQAKDRLWQEIAKVRYGMLGLVGAKSGGHFQPMTAFCEPQTGDIWFFTSDQTDLARACQGGAQAMFVVQAKDQAFQACVGGALELDRDRTRIDKYWGPLVAAWYPGGKDDPSLTLLRFRVSDAQIWLSESNPVRFFWEIAKANVSKEQPDVGQSIPVDMASAMRSAH